MLVDLRGRVNVEAEYQRADVWSEAQQRLLIDSLLRGYDIPKIYLRKLPEGAEVLYDVVDGKQRLTAIWGFFGDGFRLPRTASFGDLGELGGKTWSELPSAAKDRLQFSAITVTVIEDASDVEIAELFLRLQEGEPLNAAEKRNAIRGPVRDFVANTLAKHPVFPSLGIPNRRYTWNELAAIGVLLVRSKGPATIKGADLSDLYEDLAFDSGGERAAEVLALFEELSMIASSRPGMIKTRWGFVDLLICLIRLKEPDAPDWRPDQIGIFFEQFEEERKNASTRLTEWRAEVSRYGPEEVDEEDVPEFPDVMPDMFVYVQAFAREGATLESVRTRSDVMHRRLVAFLKDQ